MHRSELLAAFARDKVDSSALTSDLQTELALRFAELYERHGLIREAIAPPLWDCLPQRRRLLAGRVGCSTHRWSRGRRDLVAVDRPELPS